MQTTDGSPSPRARRSIIFRRRKNRTTLHIETHDRRFQASVRKRSHVNRSRTAATKVETSWLSRPLSPPAKVRETKFFLLPRRTTQIRPARKKLGTGPGHEL